MDIRRSTAQDDRVILEAVSRAIAKDGRSYSNEYRFAIMFSQDGKICKEEEFLDSLYVVEFLNQGNIKVLEHE
jgi:ketosteroid isomerase-like protein